MSGVVWTRAGQGRVGEGRTDVVWTSRAKGVEGRAGQGRAGGSQGVSRIDY